GAGRESKELRRTVAGKQQSRDDPEQGIGVGGVAIHGHLQGRGWFRIDAIRNPETPESGAKVAHPQIHVPPRTPARYRDGRAYWPSVGVRLLEPTSPEPSLASG